MSPSLLDGDVVLGTHKAPVRGDIVIARQANREVIKRIDRIEKGRYYLLGDNVYESKDSRHYGFVSKTDILGTIMIVFPSSTQPPKPVLPYGIKLGRAAAVILASMALVHLFRIDTFIPLIDAVIPGGGGPAIFVSLVIIFSEIFAIPFALRMKLSPLAHLMSGALVVFAPLWWLLLTIWSYSIASTTGQLGEFALVPPTGWVMALNVVWLAFNYYTLYALGYNRLKFTDIVRSLRRK